MQRHRQVQTDPLQGADGADQSDHPGVPAWLGKGCRRRLVATVRLKKE